MRDFLERLKRSADSGGDPVGGGVEPLPPGADTSDGPPPGGSGAGEWRRRALAAETQLEAVRAALDDTKRALAEARAAIDAGEQARRVERELARARAIDPEAARVLLESSGPVADVRRAVADLRRSKPFLFEPSPAAGAMGPSSPRGATPLESAAAGARASGARSDLMRYLRLRRGA